MSGEKLIKYLTKFHGAVIVSQKGSHINIELANKKKTIVPNHKELDYGTFSGILEQLHIDEDDFLELIK